MAEQAPVPPPNPYGPSTGRLSGPTGDHWVRGVSEHRVGRDPAQCAIVLAEPRVSGVHATLKMDLGSLWVRDESSNNGTWLQGTRIAPQKWNVVPVGSTLRFGPVEFAVTVE
jgi:pSer/pThr/pTyr-binding forkhead associated (FHA) protein